MFHFDLLLLFIVYFNMGSRNEKGKVYKLALWEKEAVCLNCREHQAWYFSFFLFFLSLYGKLGQPCPQTWTCFYSYYCLQTCVFLSALKE